MMSFNSAKPWLLLLAVFVAGAMVGGIVTRHIAVRTIEGVIRNPEIMRTLVEERLLRDLDLTPKQQDSVARILKNTQAELTQRRQELRPQIQKLLKEMRQEIAADLSDTQRAKFDKLADENIALLRERKE